MVTYLFNDSRFCTASGISSIAESSYTVSLKVWDEKYTPRLQITQATDEGKLLF